MWDNGNANLGAKTTGLEAANLPLKIRLKRRDQLAKASSIIRETSRSIDDDAAARSCLWLARDLQDVAAIYSKGSAS